MPRYFAEIQNNTVKRVIVADNIQWCIDNLGGIWVETFADRPDKNYAGKGHEYHPDKDNFAQPSPFPSWKLDKDCKYQPPTAAPKEQKGKMNSWNENTKSWETKSLPTDKLDN